MMGPLKNISFARYGLNIHCDMRCCIFSRVKILETIVQKNAFVALQVIQR